MSEKFEHEYPDLQKFLEWPRAHFLEPFSTRSEPFTAWPVQPYSIFTDNFCHRRAMEINLTAKTSRSELKYCQRLSPSKSTPQGHRKTSIFSEEIRLWFDLPNAGSLFAKINPHSTVKMHYDNGLLYLNGQYMYIFGGFKTNKIFDSIDLRLGVGFVSEDCNVENRLKITVLKHEKNHYHWYHKTYLAYKQLRAGTIVVTNLNRMIWEKNNVLLGWYFKPTTSAFFRAEVKDFRKENPKINHPLSFFDTCTIDLIHELNNKEKIALETKFDIHDKRIEESKIVYGYNTNNKIFKVSLNSRLDIALVTKLPIPKFEESSFLTLGLGIEGLNKGRVSYKTGVELSVNL